MIDLTVFNEGMQSRSISAENITGGKGAGALVPPEQGSQGHQAREMGLGWKTNPFLFVDAGETVTLGEIKGSGVINHIWMTPTGDWRNLILRIYWDDMDEPSVEVPVADFFCMGMNTFMQISTLAVCVNPGSGLNCYFDMPFKKGAKITFENRNESRMNVYYQIDYRLCDVPDNSVYFHSQFRRIAPVKKGDMYTILDGIKGKGHYVGTYLLWDTENSKNDFAWIGEGEIKFFIDGDRESPTICGTGLEDYFCGSYCFLDKDIEFRQFCTPYSGMQYVPVRRNRAFILGERFGMFRFHMTDPVIFSEDLTVQIQALGWIVEDDNHDRYRYLEDKLESVAYWYQTEPVGPTCQLPSVEEMRL